MLQILYEEKKFTFWGCKTSSLLFRQEGKLQESREKVAQKLIGPK
jgi:hypothetical protein